MNIFQALSLFLAAAFLVLAFLAVKVMRQRDQARANYEEAASDVDKLEATLARTREDHERRMRERTTEHDAALKKLDDECEAWRAPIDAENKRLIAERDQACDAYAALRSARNVAWTRPPRRMPKSDVKRAFAVAPDAPLWLALNQELDDYLQDLFDQVSLQPSPTMSEPMRLHLAGGIEQLRLFHKRLLEIHAAAQKVDADLEGEAPAKGGVS